MIVWVGVSFYYAVSNDGGPYNPATDSWAAMTSVAPPPARGSHSTVWTGTDMLVWGGQDYVNRLNSGGRYNPVTDTWTTTAIAGTNAFRISWPDSTNHWVLQENADLGTTNWSAVVQTPVTSGTNKSVVLPVSSGNRFYRLEKP